MKIGRYSSRMVIIPAPEIPPKINKGGNQHQLDAMNAESNAVWSKNSAAVEVLVSRQVVRHGWLNSQSTVWMEEYRCPIQHEAHVTRRSCGKLCRRQIPPGHRAIGIRALRGVTVVVSQRPTQSFTAEHRPNAGPQLATWLDDPIA